MTTSVPLHSFMRDLLEKVEESEVIPDNAIAPTRSLRARHQRRGLRRKNKKQCRSFSESPSILGRKGFGEKRLQWRHNQQEARTYSFESPVRKKASWAPVSAESSPNSVAFSPLSPKSARWSPQAAAFFVRQKEGLDPVSPKSARWRSLVRQESDSFLVCPERAFDLPVCQGLRDDLD